MKDWLDRIARQLNLHPKSYMFLMWVALLGYVIFFVQPAWFPLLTVTGWKLVWYIFLVIPAGFVLINLDHYLLAAIAYTPLVSVLLMLLAIIVLNAIFSDQPTLIDLTSLVIFK